MVPAKPQQKINSNKTTNIVAKYIFIALGFICLALGAAGAVLPVLPTTPFLLAATFCFAKGSRYFHNWFCSTKLYKKHLADYVEEKTMPLKTKLIILAFATTVMTAAFFRVNILLVRCLLVLLIIFHWWYFSVRIKTKKL